MKTLRTIRKTSDKEDPPDTRYCTPYNGLRGCYVEVSNSLKTGVLSREVLNRNSVLLYKYSEI